MNINDASKSRFLKKADVIPPITVTIDRFEEEEVKPPGQRASSVWVCYFKEIEKGVIVKASNAQILSTLFGQCTDAQREAGDEDSDLWIGRKVQVWYDPTVQMAGRAVGGIRFRGVPGGKQIEKGDTDEDLRNANRELQEANQPDESEPF